jgi:prepilin-type N-terminal cleavage/methylation domain-containing protein
MKEPTDPRTSQARGFSLIEILAVVAIIAIMAAVALPMVVNYLRVYKIRGASQEVAKEIQLVRGKAISKNVNFGMVFLTIDSTSYRWVTEDDQDLESDTPYMNNQAVPLTFSLGTDPKAVLQRGDVKRLPQGVVFSQSCPSLPAGTWQQGLRFNRLGAWCQPGTTNCPTFTVGQNFVLTTGTTGAVVCLMQSETGLSRTVTVSSGGRVQTQQ